MAIRFARYHGGICFSLAVALGFLTLIVRQRPAAVASGDQQAVMGATTTLTESEAHPAPASLNGQTVESPYAAKWREMARQYYAQHPVKPDSPSSINEAKPLESGNSPVAMEQPITLDPLGAVQLASHQRPAATNSTENEAAADESRALAEPATAEMSSLAGTIKPPALHAVWQTIADLGIAGLFAGLSAAGLGFVFFHSVWPVTRNSGTTSGPQISLAVDKLSGEKASIAADHLAADLDDRSDNHLLRIELPAHWVHQPRRLSDHLRTLVVVGSYLAICVSLYSLSNVGS